MTFSVRQLHPVDQPQWRALRLDALQRYPEAFLTTHAEQMARSDTEDATMLAQGNWFGLFFDEEMIGQGAMIPVSYAAGRHRAEIGGVYITPDNHGAGAAGALLDGLVEAAKAKGIKQLELSVAANNPRAIRFYERNGFERYGTQPRAIILDGTPQDDFFYVRFLDL